MQVRSRRGKMENPFRTDRCRKYFPGGASLRPRRIGNLQLGKTTWVKSVAQLAGLKKDIMNCPLLHLPRRGGEKRGGHAWLLLAYQCRNNLRRRALNKFAASGLFLVGLRSIRPAREPVFRCLNHPIAREGNNQDDQRNGENFGRFKLTAIALCQCP